MRTFALLYSLFFILTSIYSQSENLHIEGAITIDSSFATGPLPGTIQWDGQNFQGYDGTDWNNFEQRFIPGLPTDFEISKVITKKLTAGIDTFSVPTGFNFIITTFNSYGIFIQHGTDTISMLSYGLNLQYPMDFILGEDMRIWSPTSDILMNGFLTPSRIKLMAKNLPFENNTNQVLYMVLVDFDFNTVEIDSIPFGWVKVLYPGQTITGDGRFIGYLH